MNRLTHLDERSQARMVDVGGKPEAARSATATGRIRMTPQALAAIRDRSGQKGDVLTAARIAGIMAAKEDGRTDPAAIPSHSTLSRWTSRSRTDASPAI